MVMICKVVDATTGAPYPPDLPDKRPEELKRISNNLTMPIDCELAGITITSSVWSIDPTTDDGALFLTSPAFSGLYTSVRLDNGTDGVDYLVYNTVQTSDNQTFVFPWNVPVRATQQRQAA